MRTNEAENKELGLRLAQKLNQSSGPVAVILPLKGVSQVDAEGDVFYRPDLDRVLFDSIQLSLSDHIPLIKLDAHINDRPFAKRLVDHLIQLIEKGETRADNPQNQHP